MNDLVKKKIKMDELNLGIEQKINNNEAVVNSLHQIKTQLSNDITELNVENNKLNVEIERLRLLVTPTERGKLRRERNPTTQEMIDNIKFKSTRSERTTKTKEVLEYIHGGEEGAVFGACEFLRRYATPEMLQNFVLSLQRGKFVEKLQGKFNDNFRKSDQGMNQAVASKYQLHLSRRKYSFLCKVQEKTFNVESQTWTNNSISFGDKNITLCKKPISDRSVEKFVKGLDIGDIHIIPGYCGTFRSVTALTMMILDLHLRTESLFKN